MRTVFRGEKVRFDQEFKDGSTALVPRDATWPKYSIKDTSGVVVQTGSPVTLGNGKYRTEWTSLNSAPLSMDNDENWVIEWTFVDENGKFYSLTENFILLDDVKIEETSREQKFISLASSPYLAKLQLPMQPFALDLKVLEQNSEAQIYAYDKNEMRERGNPDSGIYSYEVEIPAVGRSNCQLVLLWTITDAPTSTPRYQYQLLTCIGVKMMSMIPQVRMLIDKFQKVGGTYQAYEDSDIVEYLMQGSQLVNATYPTTFWDFNPGSPLYVAPIQYFTIMGAAWYGLTAQHLLENDLAFSFNGLTTTLDVDRTSGIESAIGRMNDHIKDTLPAAKYKVNRLIKGSGHVGTRVFGRRPTLENISYKIGTMHGSSILDYFSDMGIFYP